MLAWFNRVLWQTALLILGILGFAAAASAQVEAIFQSAEDHRLKRRVAAFDPKIVVVTPVVFAVDYDPHLAAEILAQTAPLIEAFAKGLDRRFEIWDPFKAPSTRVRADIALFYMKHFDLSEAQRHASIFTNVSLESDVLLTEARCHSVTMTPSEDKRLVHIYISTDLSAVERVSCVGESLLSVLRVRSNKSSAHWKRWLTSNGDRLRPDILAAFSDAVRRRGQGEEFDQRAQLSYLLR